MKVTELNRLIRDNVAQELWPDTEVWVEGCDCVAESVGINVHTENAQTIVTLARRNPQFRAKSDAIPDTEMRQRIQTFLQQAHDAGYSWEEIHELMPRLHLKQWHVTDAPVTP